MATKSVIQSMLFLLEDPDPFVKEEVLSSFYKMGEQVIPLLDECRLETPSTDGKQIATDLLFELAYPGLYEDFFELYTEKIQTYTQLEKALFLLSRFGNPTIRTSIYKQKLDLMARFIANDVTYALDPVEQMNIVLNYVFQTEGFAGCGDDLFKPDYTYMHQVLDQKKGIPLSLAMVVLGIASRLELPFFGVNMPLHFILLFENDDEIVYIDPFQNGKFLSKKECDTFLQMNSIEPDKKYFQKATMSQMLIRTMRNLNYSFEKEGDSLRASKLKQIIALHEQFYAD